MFEQKLMESKVSLNRTLELKRFNRLCVNIHLCDNPPPARVVELVYTADLKSAAVRLTGSSPVLGTSATLLGFMKNIMNMESSILWRVTEAFLQSPSFH